jgi:hypothetical protein
LARQNFLSAESLFGKLQLDKEKKWKAAIGNYCLRIGDSTTFRYKNPFVNNDAN